MIQIKFNFKKAKGKVRKGHRWEEGVAFAPNLGAPASDPALSCQH
jgi:hypothetical protein